MNPDSALQDVLAALVRNKHEHWSFGVTCAAVSAALAQLQMQHGLVLTTADHEDSRQQLMLCWFLGEQSADLLTKQAFIFRQDAMQEIRPWNSWTHQQLLGMASMQWYQHQCKNTIPELMSRENLQCNAEGRQAASGERERTSTIRQDTGHTHEAPAELQLTDSGGSRVSWRHQSKAHRAKGYACVFLPCFYL